MKNRRRFFGLVAVGVAGSVWASRRSGSTCSSCPPWLFPSDGVLRCPPPPAGGEGGTEGVAAPEPASSPAAGGESKRAGLGRVGGVLAGILLLGFGAGCHREAAEGGAASGRSLPTAEVRAVVVSAGKRWSVEEVVGTVRARKRSVVEAKVSGRIASMAAVPGRSVKAGELLLELDAQEIAARIEQARAVLEQAEREWVRFESLFKQEAVTRAEFDAVEARRRVAKAAVSEAETLGGYTRVTAPFDGVVVRKLAEVGDLAGPGRGLLEIEDPASVRLEADVPLQLVDRVKLGDRLEVTVVGATERGMKAEISEIEPTADAASRTFRMKLDLPPDSGARAGAFGRVAVPVAESDVLRVPAGAVRVRGQMEMVFVVGEGVARLRLVKTGKVGEGEVEVVSGLDPGERVVVEGPATLMDGQPVAVR